jgi:mono/diheme cytochrome c family protein
MMKVLRVALRHAVLISTTAILVMLIANVAAQQRPAPQAPPRRTAPQPRTPPPTKGGTSSDSGEATPAKPAPEPAQAKAATLPSAAAADTTPAGAGAALYKKNGCYECHVNNAQGGPQGPRLGPNPIPLPRFMAYVRGPAGDMPPFTKKVLSDEDLQNIYAFLQALPQPPPVNNIPLLAP